MRGRDAEHRGNPFVTRPATGTGRAAVPDILDRAGTLCDAPADLSFGDCPADTHVHGHPAPESSDKVSLSRTDHRPQVQPPISAHAAGRGGRQDARPGSGSPQDPPICACCANTLDDPPGRSDQLVPGEPEDRPPQAHQHVLALSIADEPARGHVPGPSVHFDGDPLGREGHVDEIAPLGVVRFPASDLRQAAGRGCADAARSAPQCPAAAEQGRATKRHKRPRRTGRAGSAQRARPLSECCRGRRRGPRSRPGAGRRRRAGCGCRPRRGAGPARPAGPSPAPGTRATR